MHLSLGVCTCYMSSRCYPLNFLDLSCAPKDDWDVETTSGLEPRPGPIILEHQFLHVDRGKWKISNISFLISNISYIFYSSQHVFLDISP